MLTCIIADDEQTCVETLQLILQKKFATLVSVAATTNKPVEIEQLINIHQPDIVFLDIEMPHMSGIELLQSLEQINFEVIFTTAHQHYALQAIKLNALDYLLKPINVSELDVAINKCINRKKEISAEMMRSFLQLTHNEQTGIKKIPLTINNMVKLIPVSDIIRIESSSNYSIIYFTTGSKLTVSRTLKAFEEHLAPYNFIRIHQSHLINREHVTGFKNGEKAYIIMKGNDVIEISRRKKQEVLQLLKGL